MYGIKPNNKYKQYKIIIDYAKVYLNNINYVGSLPGISGFAFEQTVTKEYPQSKIDCFEADKERYFEAAYNVPNNVNLNWGNIEDSYPEHKYDILWLDYCGQCNLVQSELVYYLNEKSIFAITECKSHGIKKKHLVLREEAKLLTDYEYGHMRFRCYFIGPEFHNKYSQLISNIS